MRAEFLPNICRFHVSKEEEKQPKSAPHCQANARCHRVCSVTGLCEGRQVKDVSRTEKKERKVRRKNLSISRSSSSPFNAIESKQIKLPEKEGNQMRVERRVWRDPPNKPLSASEKENTARN